MARVRSISNHPYGDRMRAKGVEYDAAEEDVELLVSLRRVVPVLEQTEKSAQTYATRELQASEPSASSGRTRRRAVPPSERTDTSAPPSADET
jgi:hypothetical protein